MRIAPEFTKALWLPILLSLIVLLVSSLDLLGLVAWKGYALRPRDVEQWYGILTAPLLHGSWGHLGSNLPPLFVLSFAITYFYPRISVPVILTSYVAPGLWAWVAARDSLHLGASGVVYALAFFLFFSGIFRKDALAMVLTLLVAFFYGSMVWGILPAQPGVSWESHAFGGLAGIILAFYFRKKGPPRPKYSWEEEPEQEKETGPWDYKKWFVPPEGFDHPE